MLQISVYDPQTGQWRAMLIDAEGTSSEFAEYLDRMIAELPPLDAPVLTVGTPDEDAISSDTYELPDESALPSNPFSFLLPASFTSGGDAA